MIACSAARNSNIRAPLWVINERRSKDECPLSTKSIDLGAIDGGPEWGIKTGSCRRGCAAAVGSVSALAWEVEKKLADDRLRPIIFYTRLATCWHPWVKGFTIMVNGFFNGWRMEDVWLDK